VLYDAKRHAHTAQGLAVSTVWGDLLWCDGGWLGSCHEQELLALSGLDGVLDAASVAAILDRGFRGMARPCEHWHAPLGDRRTKDRLTDGQRAFNRCQAGLRALVEQTIAHLSLHPKKLTENLALSARIGYVEYDRRSQGAFSLVYLRKHLG
jgi:hypothetical protein